MDDAGKGMAHAPFGAPAAERDIAYGLADYFVDTTAYERIRSGNKVIVVGSRRGSGKTAIFQMLAREERARGTSVVELSPDDYSYEMMASASAADERGSWAKTSAYAVAWKYLLLVQVMQQLARTIGNRGANRPIVRFLRDNLVGHQDSPIASLISYLKRIESVKIGTYEAGIKVRELDRLYTKNIAAEYRYQFPDLRSVFEAFRGGARTYDRDELEHVCLELALGEHRVSESAGWVADQEPEALIHILWRVGFLLAKVPGAAPRTGRGTAYAGYHHVSTLSLRNATGFEVHPMFRSYLDVA